jgi:hypothetical protein
MIIKIIKIIKRIKIIKIIKRIKIIKIIKRIKIIKIILNRIFKSILKAQFYCTAPTIYNN